MRMVLQSAGGPLDRWIHLCQVRSGHRVGGAPQVSCHVWWMRIMPIDHHNKKSSIVPNGAPKVVSQKTQGGTTPSGGRYPCRDPVGDPRMGHPIPAAGCAVPHHGHLLHHAQLSRSVRHSGAIPHRLHARKSVCALQLAPAPVSALSLLLCQGTMESAPHAAMDAPGVLSMR